MKVSKIMRRDKTLYLIKFRSVQRSKSFRIKIKKGLAKHKITWRKQA